MKVKKGPRPKYWQQTKIPYMVKYVPTGIYYVKKRIHGKLKSKSIETKTYSVAREKLKDVLK